MNSKELTVGCAEDQLPAIVTNAYNALLSVWAKSDRRLSLEQVVERAAVFMDHLAVFAEEDVEYLLLQEKRNRIQSRRMVRRAPSK